MRRFPRFPVSCVAAALLASCGDAPAELDMPSLHDLTRADPAIAEAAHAVVRIRSALASGSGSFISRDGLLMTNNHVLGAAVCPRNGCWVELSFAFERGQPYAEPRLVFALPRQVDVGLDLAVLQVFEANNPNQPLSTPDFLQLSARSAADLVGEHVTVVGHPLGRLKKWSEGEVIASEGTWFTATNDILPGDSGSPVLDEGGSVVGLIHRAQDGDAQFTERGALTYALGTAADALMKAMDDDLPAIVRATDEEFTAEEAVRMHALFLNAREPMVTVAGEATSVVELLGSACDAGLTQSGFGSPEELDDALAPCVAAQDWIDCRASDDATAFRVCPASEARTRWAERYRAMHDRARALNGTYDLYALSFATAALETSEGAGKLAGGRALERGLRDARAKLDFPTALYTSAFEIWPESTRTLIDQYDRAPLYRAFAWDIAAASAWLMVSAALPAERGYEILDDLMHDPDVDVGARLYIEQVEYQWGRLH